MSWALDAIEREAERRANDQLIRELVGEGAGRFRVLGLSISQIQWLKHDFETRTGRPASEIGHRS